MKTTLFAICLLLFTMQVSAEKKFTWELISSSTDGVGKVYGDRNSIRKNNSGNYIVWMAVNYDKGDYAGSSHVSSQEYDCVQLRYRWLYFEQHSSHYGKGKKTLYIDAEELKTMGEYHWRYPKPNTNEYFQVNWVCKK